MGLSDSVVGRPVCGAPEQRLNSHEDIVVGLLLSRRVVCAARSCMLHQEPWPGSRPFAAY